MLLSRARLGTTFRAVAPGAFVVLVSACRAPLSSEECTALLDRYVELLARSDRPPTSEAEVLKLKAQAREKASRDAAFRRCSKEVSRGQLECALRADDTDRFEQCLL